MTISIIITLIIAFAAQLFSHFFPWAVLLGGAKLTRIQAYIIGSGTFGLVYTSWQAVQGYTQQAAMFWVTLICSGFGVVLGYLISGWIDGQKAKKDKAAGDAVISALIEASHEREETR